MAAADCVSTARPLQAFEEDPAAGRAGKGLQGNPMLLGLTPEQYMLKQLASVRASDLEQALLILPFSDALRLLSYFCTWLKRGAEVGLLATSHSLPWERFCAFDIIGRRWRRQSDHLSLLSPFCCTAHSGET